MKVEKYKVKAAVEMMRYDGTANSANAIHKWSERAAFAVKVGVDGKGKVWTFHLRTAFVDCDVQVGDYVAKLSDGHYCTLDEATVRRLYVVPEPKAKKASK